MINRRRPPLDLQKWFNPNVQLPMWTWDTPIMNKWLLIMWNHPDFKLLSELKERAVLEFCALMTGFNLLPSHHITTFYLAPATARANTPSLRVGLQTRQMSLVSEVGNVEYGSLCSAVQYETLSLTDSLKWWKYEKWTNKHRIGKNELLCRGLFIKIYLVQCLNILHLIEL